MEQTPSLLTERVDNPFHRPKADGYAATPGSVDPTTTTGKSVRQMLRIKLDNKFYLPISHSYEIKTLLASPLDSLQWHLENLRVLLLVNYHAMNLCLTSTTDEDQKNHA